MSKRHIPVVCTIAAKNYLAQVRTLCDSFLENHADGIMYVLFTDSIRGFIEPAKERFHVVTIEQLAIETAPEMSFWYDITEYATALKPYFLSYLLVRHRIEKLIYLDPDIMLFASLEKVYEELDRTEILLTPHLDRDYPEDGHRPDDAHVLRSGVFNLGFIGVRDSRNTHAFLDWWKAKLYRKCVIDHKRGYFVDQRFVDLATTLFRGMGMISDPSLNVAYWNLHSRAISLRDERFFVNGKPLVFFHFSGFDPRSPDVLSKHQDRIRLVDHSSLAQLFQNYVLKLKENAYEMSSQLPYSHGVYRNGKRIGGVERRLYRERFQTQTNFDPFDFSAHSTGFRVSVLVERFKAWLKKIVILTTGPWA